MAARAARAVPPSGFDAQAEDPPGRLDGLRLVHDDIERILLGEQEIRARIERVAAEITALYAGEEPTVIAVLEGSVVFVADLIRRLPIPLHLAFVWAESYRQGTVPGRLEFGGLPSADDLSGRRILLVDDILDSGRTLQAIRANQRGSSAFLHRRDPHRNRPRPCSEPILQSPSQPCVARTTAVPPMSV